MNLIIFIAAIIAANLSTDIISDKNMEEYIYFVERANEPVEIDGKWDKDPWKRTESLVINNFVGDIPGFRPVTEAKMVYDDDYVYVIFKVKDKYVMCTTDKINGPVWEDSCVEFFFSPDMEQPGYYFNLEVNCGGTALMRYNIVPRVEFSTLRDEDIKKIEIAATMPTIVYPEITGPVTWLIEYKIPLAVLKSYTKISRPSKGVVWMANFYKIAVKTSNPHYMTWTVVKSEEPDFHRPEYFGKIVFN